MSESVYVPPVEILPETVLVSTSIGSHSNRYTVMHQPVDSDTPEPRCGLDGRYRTVEPVVYPFRRLCCRDACWAALEIDVPEWLETQYCSPETRDRRASIQRARDD